MTDYADIINVVVQKLIDTQGKNFVVAQANKSGEVELDEDGEVISVDNGEKALEDILEQFNNVMGPVAYALSARAIEDEYGDVDLELPEELREQLG
ncbi:MAG: hypothetical protein ABEJ75_03935 [Candidatus Nanohaloarchaea archaeon]